MCVLPCIACSIRVCVCVFGVGGVLGLDSWDYTSVFICLDGVLSWATVSTGDLIRESGVGSCLSDCDGVLCLPQHTLVLAKLVASSREPEESC